MSSSAEGAGGEGVPGDPPTDPTSLLAVTAGIAHEIRNPLHFIANNAEVVSELSGELDDILAESAGSLPATVRDDLGSLRDELAEAAAQIGRHTERLAAIVDGMRATSRAGDGRRAIVDLNLLVSDATRLAIEGLPGIAATVLADPVELELDADLPPVTVDAIRLSQAVVNLVTNALQAVGEGTSDGQPARVVVSTAREPGAVLVSVADNGPGIPSDLRDRVFEPFVSTKRGVEDAGLGLSQVWDIVVEDHGGSVTVESTPGSATTVTLSVPTD